jgi:uncharacterized protein YaaW (UPF0174 family)
MKLKTFVIRSGSSSSSIFFFPTALTVFFLFSSFLNLYAEEMPNYLGLPGASRMKALGEAWRALDDDARVPYTEKAEIDKQRVAVEKEGLLPRGSDDEWHKLSATKRQELLDELRSRNDIVAVSRGISRKAAV